MPAKGKLPPQHQDHQPGQETAMEPRPDFMPRYPGSGRLKDKIALVTGGDSGIGRAVCVLFAREGADVAFVFKEETRDARETARLVEAEGRRCRMVMGDIGDSAFCDRAVRLVIDQFGRLDVLVNHAGEQHPTKSLEEIDDTQLARTFQTNVFGYLFMTRAALPQLGKGAAIVNTTSVTAYRGSSHLIDYAATRGAIVSFTRSLALSVVDRGIRVNGVAPGPIWTPLIPATFDEEHVETFGQKVPLGRPGQPNEVAPAYLFLACEDASYMTGQVIHVDGGDFASS
jgi:NAD(P)-dependent dehydrogenase (short-subunit alcohol dehydrogenase family)